MLNQSEFGIFIGIFCAIYVGFFYYFISYSQVIVNDIIHLEFTFHSQVAIGLAFLCIFMWFLLFAATIWRGNDIGFPTWISVLLYMAPAIPRVAGMFTWGQKILGLLEIIATLLFFATAGLYLYLPSGWTRREGKILLNRYKVKFDKKLDEILKKIFSK